MTDLLEQQLILTRDNETLRRDNSKLEDKNEGLKRDSLSLIQLIDKQKIKLKGLEDEAVKVLDRVRDEKVAWESQKQEESEKLQVRELAANKIINRENYVKTQTQELMKQQAEITRREQANAVIEAGFVQREEMVKKLEEQSDKHWKEAQKVNDYSKQAMEKLKVDIIKEVNKWEIK